MKATDGSDDNEATCSCHLWNAVGVTVCNVTSSFSSIPQCSVCSAAPQTERLLSHSIGHTVHNLPVRSTTCAACFSSPVLWLTRPDPGIDFFGDSLREPQKNRQLDKLPFLHLQRSVHLANKTPRRWWGCCLVILPSRWSQVWAFFPSFFLVLFCFVFFRGGIFHENLPISSFMVAV